MQRGSLCRGAGTGKNQGGCAAELSREMLEMRQESVGGEAGGRRGRRRQSPGLGMEA